MAGTAETDQLTGALQAPPELSEAELAAATDPQTLLARAWDLELWGRSAERVAALDRLEELLATAATTPSPPAGRSWELELLAERALDIPINADALTATVVEQALELADRVLLAADPGYPIAAARAVLARGRALSWTGTDEATRRAADALNDAAERFGRLGHDAWRAYAVYWHGYGVCFLSGQLERAVDLMAQALEILPAGSPRRSMVLSFYADALIALGEWDRAQQALDEGVHLATAEQNPRSVAYVAWSRARLEAARGDAIATERLLHEVERDGGDWSSGHGGGAFLLDAAEMLNRLGLDTAAHAYFTRACERRPEPESVMLTQATLMARSGDPAQGLQALQELARGDWMEKRLMWRHTLLTSWAMFRAGRQGAGELAARALEQAAVCGGVRVALAGEPALVAALAPLAESAGSSHARRLLLGDRELLVRLFGAPSVVRADGSNVKLPVGQPGQLVRMLALEEAGLPVDVVLDRLFPDATAQSARHRLRQLLTRLRSSAGAVVVREDDHLRLQPAWVDVREFLATADRARAVRPPRSVQLAYAALALCRGSLLPTDPYASWTEGIREQVEYRHLELLELIAADASARGSDQEALTALEAAFRHDPDDAERRNAVVAALRRLGRDGAADYLASGQ